MSRWTDFRDGALEVASVVFPMETLSTIGATDYFLGTNMLGLKPDIPEYDLPPSGEYNDLRISQAWDKYIDRLGDRKPTYAKQQNTVGNYTSFVTDVLRDDAALKTRAALTPTPTDSPLAVDPSINI